MKERGDKSFLIYIYIYIYVQKKERNIHYNSDRVNFHEARVNFSLTEDQTESSSPTQLSKNERRREKREKL